MGVVLGKAANPEQTVQSTGKFVAVHKTKFRIAQRQILIGVRLQGIYQDAARTVHRLNGIFFVINNSGIHVFFVMVPVSGSFPKGPAHDLRRGNFHIAVAFVHFSPVLQDAVAKHHAIGQEEWHAGRFIPKCEKIQFPSQLAVISSFCLFLFLQVFFQLFLFRKCNSINPLQRFPIGVAPPIGGIAGQQLDSVRLYIAGRTQMRAGAEVRKFTLPVKADWNAFR